jgi:Mrp family chromosome partitioning ATPase
MNAATKVLSQNALSAQFHLLRARIESDIEGPAVVLITSAEPNDGSRFTAYTLAQCFARTGRRTTLVDATVAGPEHTPQTSARPDVPCYVRLPRERVAASRDELTSFIYGVRSENDVTIIDTDAILTDATAMALVGAVDGVLMTVCLGRAATSNDTMAIRLVEQSLGRIIGVVTTTRAVIADFESAPSEYAAALPPARSSELPVLTPVAGRMGYKVLGASIVLSTICIIAIAVARLGHYA